MSEPSSGVPERTSGAEVHEASEEQSQAPDQVQLDVDEEKLQKWDEVKSDYQIDPDGKPMPNIWDAGDVGEAEPEHETEADAEQRQEVNNDDAPEVFATDSGEDSGEDKQPT